MLQVPGFRGIKTRKCFFVTCNNLKPGTCNLEPGTRPLATGNPHKLTSVNFSYICPNCIAFATRSYFRI